ncbi:MAG: hypothetical protein ACP5I4_08935 [Oceanipulchritudo sp.]
MTNFNFEGQPEGDWDDRGNLSWSELDWQQFLQRQEKEVARFLRYYDDCPLEASERLDWVARQMGWDAEDWSISDFPEEEDCEPWNPENEEEPDLSDTDPYTLHRHPVYVVCTGLFLQLRYLWRNVLKAHEGPVDSLLCWDFAESLNEAEKHSLMAMQSMDMGDFLLCVVHLKRALRGINLAMSLLPDLAAMSPVGAPFQAGMLARTFDLREVCLRVMHDCREEERRDFRE